MTVVIGLFYAALVMAIGTHALLLWTRRQQLRLTLMRTRHRPTDSPFGDDATCFIEGLSLRSAIATALIDFSLDVYWPLIAQHLFSLPLFDARQLPTLQISVWRIVAVAALSAPFAALSLLLSRAIHVSPRRSPIVGTTKRALTRTSPLAVTRLLALVFARDFVALLAVMFVLMRFVSSLRPSPFASALPLAIGGLCAALLSHPLDSLALQAAAPTRGIHSDEKFQLGSAELRYTWFGLFPRVVRVVMITVCVPFWFTLASMATAAMAAVGH
jgi:hypothetical protein